jgi:hemerythrin
MTTIEWKEEYSVNVKELDNQHKRLIDLMNGAYDAFYESKSKEQVRKLIDEVLAHTAIHFSTEEKYFDKFNYEFTEEHKNEHYKLTRDAAAISIDFTNNGVAVVPKLIEFLDNWLTNHIVIHDKKYVKCFNNNGLF